MTLLYIFIDHMGFMVRMLDIYSPTLQGVRYVYDCVYVCVCLWYITGQYPCSLVMI